MSSRPDTARRTSLPPLDPGRFAPSADRPVRAKARPLARQADIQPHHHAWAQLVFSLEGTLRVSTLRPDGSGTSYLVPPAQAVWIPPGRTHSVTAVERVELRTVYLAAPQATQLPDWPEGRVMAVSPLLRELVQALALLSEQATLSAEALAREQALALLVRDELLRARPVPLGLALPGERRLRRLCEQMLAQPGRHADLEGWAAEVAASPRTLARLFREHLGTTFGQWRQQLLLAQALTLAARGRPVHLIATELGYRSPSAFGAMVKRTVGVSPGQFLASA
ncbi:AraC family transcriptional regulator [Ideonella dechloratans]|uniref:AraC family transcriptional regulator n=1 Tax=Ideonella dechloratans TaxID=36863 RepID=A0A643F8S4_IDEDE|nr:helix-turn-helix transcriptional regulator [Ideonella dechloratans]KAB0577071.1 AraC family transcriptional regulator [Ideonella dechloratans]UFU08649.1 helix-turn-helix transcriptional regulator [Ideonella dechloratans]